MTYTCRTWEFAASAKQSPTHSW